MRRTRENNILTNKAQSSIQKVNDLALTAKKQATARLKHVDALIMEREAKILAKLADGAIGTARVVDETVVNTKNFVSDIMPDFGWALVEGEAKLSATNTHTVENAEKKIVNRIEGLNIKGSGVVPKGTGEVSKEVSYIPHVKEAKNVIAERTKGLDLNEHPTTTKQMSSKKMKELKDKVDKCEYISKVCNRSQRKVK